jgi:large subunit ribosomal protein L29
MTIEEIRALEASAITAQQKEAAEQMFHLRMKLAMGQTESLKKLRTLRKDRARMLTVARERELASSTPAGVAATAKGSK